MIPNNYVGQPGIPQPQPQPQDHQQGMPGMNLDPSRMWQLQQQQQQQQHLAQQLRAQGNGTQQQMMEFLRTRGLSPAHAQAAIAQQQRQQQLGYGGMPFGANNSAPFSLDSAQNLQPAQQHFGNPQGAQNMANPMQFQSALARNSNPMFGNQGGTMRQLDLLLAQQNSQNQNGIHNVAALRQMQQQHAQQQQQQQQQQQPHAQQQQHQAIGGSHIPPGFFGGGMNVPSGNVAAANIQQANALRQSALMPQLPGQDGQGQPQSQQPRPSLETMRAQVVALRQAVQQGEVRLRNLQSQQQAGSDQALEREIATLKHEIEKRRMIITQIMDQAAKKVAEQRMSGNGQGIVPNPMKLGPMATSPVPPQRVASTVQNPTQVAWMQQAGSSTAQFNNSPRPGPAGAHLMPNGNAHQQNRQMNTPQLPPQMLATPQQQHVRTVTTPLQVHATGVNQPGFQPSQNATPNVFPTTGMATSSGQPLQAPQPAQQPQGQPQSQVPGLQLRPMPQETFQSLYQKYLASNPKDQSLLVLDNRPVDLYKMHCEVTNAGGINRVRAADMWPIIGARLGYVNIPGTDTEPPRAGPAFAHQLQIIYNEFLYAFDRSYYFSLARRQQQHILQKQAVENGQNRPTAAPEPKLVGELVAYSVIPAAELQRRGVAPDVIRLVESNRAKLQEMYNSQRSFHNGVEQGSHNNQNQAGNVPQRIPSNSMAEIPQPAMAGQNGMHPLGQPNVPQMPAQKGNPTMLPGSAMPPNASHPQQVGTNPGQNLMRQLPSQQQREAATQLVMRIKEDIKGAPFNVRNDPPFSEGQLFEYKSTFEQLHRLAMDLDSQLGLYACVMKEDAIRKLAQMIALVQQQRQLLSSSPPKFLLNLEGIKVMSKQVQSATEAFRHYFANAAGLLAGQREANGPSQQGPTAMPPQRPPVPQIPQQPPTVPTVPVAPAMPTASASSPVAIAAMTPIQKKPTPKPAPETPAASAPTPSASAATPAASAPTPTHVAASPQTPKSPKTKPKAKPQPKPRKPSKAQPPAPSTSAASPADVKPSVTPAATPASAPTPDASAGVKRPREDDAATPSTSAAAAAQPAAKKIKTEWDEPPSDALSKRQAAADAVNTDEDAIKFFEQMSSWLNQVSTDGDNGQDVLKSQISTSLEEILKAYPDVPDDGGLTSLAGTNFLDSIHVGSSSPKPVDPSDFFDFTSYLTEEDAGSKAATPDLVQASSSVGPSPGSASETEAHPPASSSTADTAKIVEPKSEQGEGVDAISPELYRAFDGGESAFYNASDNWKWDQPMTALDQPWAVYSTST